MPLTETLGTGISGCGGCLVGVGGLASLQRLEQIQNPYLIFGINPIRLGFKSIPNQILLPEFKSNPIQILKSNP